MDTPQISNPGGIDFQLTSTPRGWGDRFMPFPRVTPGLLEVNAAGIEMSSFPDGSLLLDKFLPDIFQSLGGCN